MEKFVDVILPLPLHSSFTYSLPEEMAGDVQIGCRVIVPFGRKKYYTAIVRNIHYSAPTEYEVKEVSALLDAMEFTYSDNFKNIFDLYINNSCTAPGLLGSKSVDDSIAA